MGPSLITANTSNPLKLNNNAPPTTAANSGPSLKHDLGQLFGHTLNALPGYSTLGNNITNPEVNYLGVYNPGYSAPTPATPKGPANLTGSTTTVNNQSAPQFTAQDIAAYNTYKGQANQGLSDLLGQYNTAVQGENSAFNTAQNVNQSDFNKQQGNYNQAVTGQNQDLLRQTNQDMQGVSTAYRNLMDLLGAYGGGASSVALQWAPNAAKTYQDRLMSGDKQTAASNLASLASNWNDFITGFDQRKQQQLDQHNQNLAQAKQDYTHTQAQLNRIIDAINNRSDTPGNIGTNLNTIEASIPNSVFVNPTYTGVTPSFTRPSLASFQSQMPTATISTSTMPTNSSATPVLNFLLSQGQKQKQDATAVVPVDLQKKTPVMF